MKAENLINAIRVCKGSVFIWAVFDPMKNGCWIKANKASVIRELKDWNKGSIFRAEFKGADLYIG